MQVTEAARINEHAENARLHYSEVQSNAEVLTRNVLDSNPESHLFLLLSNTKTSKYL